ncbi:uncharacterized protein BXZ73DRAFT_102330 [Epithele typhae]|uniref:uncharacterized protein n=1 Tax=Epithele typhae TaxID=378194 RepID=UPI002007D65F|nr:uncharacterized protein BXZ73DRAFT_102330 [Epithele typhae]KAH9928489.1 hypothetical protein BXZ73DRAFT_102330 [Epithele typhae]
MHSVNIRRPDSVIGSEDSDQADYRLALDSPTGSKLVRFRSPPRSPRTSGLLLALGDVIQQDEDDGEWEEEESGEQESNSGEEQEEVAGDPQRTLFADIAARPAPILGLSEDAARILQFVASRPNAHTRDESPPPPSSLGGVSSTLVDGLSTQPGSPGDELAAVEEDETITHMISSVIPDSPPAFTSSPRGSVAVSDDPSRSISLAPSPVHGSPTPLPRSLEPIPESQLPSYPTLNDPDIPSHTGEPPGHMEHRARLDEILIPPPSLASLSQRDSLSSSSGLLSPIDFTAGFATFSRPTSLASHRHESSLDSRIAELPERLRGSPPRSPRRMSTLSILSSPFGSPSRRTIHGNTGFDPPSASTLFSPRFGAFPIQPSQSDEDRQSNTRPSRSDSVDSFLLSSEEPNSSSVEIHIDGPSNVSGPRAPVLLDEDDTAEAVEPEDMMAEYHTASASDFLIANSADTSFESDESMSALYEGYYTPTIRTGNVGVAIAEPEEVDDVFVAEVGPLVVPASHDVAPVTSPAQPESHTERREPVFSPPFARPPSAASSLSERSHVFSPPLSRPSSSLSGQVPNFSRPSSARNSIIFTPPPRPVSPAAPAADDNAEEPSSRASSSLGYTSNARPRLSVQTGPSSEGSRKVPFGFRNSMSSLSSAGILPVGHSVVSCRGGAVDVVSCYEHQAFKTPPLVYGSELLRIVVELFGSLFQYPIIDHGFYGNYRTNSILCTSHLCTCISSIFME